MGPRAGLDRCGFRSPDRPVRSKSLYRLSYRAHEYKYHILNTLYRVNTRLKHRRPQICDARLQPPTRIEILKKEVVRHVDVEFFFIYSLFTYIG
jgi:hypothetical protein